MSCLTETSLISDSPNNNSNNNPNNNSNNNFYNKVYLCLEKEGNPNYVNGFNCYKFDSIQSAEKHIKNVSPLKIEKRMYSIIPVYKILPDVFHIYFLNYKLRNIHWNNKISLINCIYKK